MVHRTCVPELSAKRLKQQLNLGLVVLLPATGSVVMHTPVFRDSIRDCRLMMVSLPISRSQEADITK